LAGRQDVESAEFYQAHRVGCLINTTSEVFDLTHAGNIPAYSVISKDAKHRDAALVAVIADCVKAFLNDEAVVLYCNNGFHRTPIGAVAIMKVVCGVPADRALKFIAERRLIWRGFVFRPMRPSERDAKLLKAMAWASALEPDSRASLLVLAAPTGPPALTGLPADEAKRGIPCAGWLYVCGGLAGAPRRMQHWRQQICQCYIRLGARGSESTNPTLTSA
jgi:hypothetical protein